MSRIATFLDRLGIALACLAGAGVLVLQLAEIALRLLGGSIVYSVDLSGFLMVAIIFFALGDVTRRRQHIVADFFVLLLPEGWRPAMEYVFNLLLTAAYVAALIWIVGGLAWGSWLDGTRSDGIMKLPLVIPQGLIITGLVVMLLRVVCDLAAGLGRRGPSSNRAPGSR